MTTEAAAERYEAEHLAQWKDKGYAVYNPLNKDVEDLPVIYGFNNGGSNMFLSAVLVAEDGTHLGGHACSSEGYMPHDLGILEGSRPDRHEEFKKHYPDGYRMDFVGYVEVLGHSKLISAIEKSKEKYKESVS